MKTSSVTYQPVSYSSNPLNPEIEDDSTPSSLGKADRKAQIRGARNEISGHLDSIPVSWQQEDPVGPAASLLQKGIQKAREVFTLKTQDTSPNMQKYLEETKKAEFSYGKGYLLNTSLDYQNYSQSPLKLTEQDTSFVFSKEQERFIFAGTSKNPFLPASKQPLSSKNSVVCEGALKGAIGHVDPSSGKFLVTQPVLINATIAGTTNEKVCNQFKTHFLKDVASSLAKEPPSLKDAVPYSDTPVFDCSEQICKRTGNLMNLPNSVREKILSGDFSACGYFTLEKTELSQGTYEEVGAIAVGTTNPDVCKSLNSLDFRSVIQRVEELKNSNQD